MLPCCGPRAYGVFVKALVKAERDYQHVLDRLERTMSGEDPDSWDETDSLRCVVKTKNGASC